MILLYILIGLFFLCITYGIAAKIHFKREERRAKSVYEFITKVHNMAARTAETRIMQNRDDWEEPWKIKAEMLNQKRMYRSSRPLTLEEYFTPEQQAILHEGDSLDEKEYEAFVENVRRVYAEARKHHNKINS